MYLLHFNARSFTYWQLSDISQPEPLSTHKQLRFFMNESAVRITADWNGKLMFREVSRPLATPGHGATQREMSNTPGHYQVPKSVLVLGICVALTLGPGVRGQEAASEKASSTNQQSGMGGGASTGGRMRRLRTHFLAPLRPTMVGTRYRWD